MNCLLLVVHRVARHCCAVRRRTDRSAARRAALHRACRAATHHGTGRTRTDRTTSAEVKAKVSLLMKKKLLHPLRGTRRISFRSILCQVAFQPVASLLPLGWTTLVLDPTVVRDRE
jgi:hypothetical protein